jgi:hypothetical protein
MEVVVAAAGEMEVVVVAVAGLRFSLFSSFPVELAAVLSIFLFSGMQRCSPFLSSSPSLYMVGFDRGHGRP